MADWTVLPALESDGVGRLGPCVAAGSPPPA